MTPKQVTPHELTTKALLNGARLMVVKIGEQAKFRLFYQTIDYAKYYLPLKQGDDIYIGEEFSYSNSFATVEYKIDDKFDTSNWMPASQMSYNESRLHFTVGEVSVKKVSEINKKVANKLMGTDYSITEYDIKLNHWLKAQDIEPTDYIALVELLDKDK